MNTAKVDRIVKHIKWVLSFMTGGERDAVISALAGKAPRPKRDKLTPRERWRFKRWLFWKHGGAVCSYCGRSMALEHLTIDHIQPISRGGAVRDINNLTLACIGCNRAKGHGWFVQQESKTALL